MPWYILNVSLKTLWDQHAFPDLASTLGYLPRNRSMTVARADHGVFTAEAYVISPAKPGHFAHQKQIEPSPVEGRHVSEFSQ